MLTVREPFQTRTTHPAHYKWLARSPIRSMDKIDHMRQTVSHTRQFQYACQHEWMAKAISCLYIVSQTISANSTHYVRLKMECDHLLYGLIMAGEIPQVTDLHAVVYKDVANPNRHHPSMMKNKTAVLDEYHHDSYPYPFALYARLWSCRQVSLMILRHMASAMGTIVKRYKAPPKPILSSLSSSSSSTTTTVPSVSSGSASVSASPASMLNEIVREDDDDNDKKSSSDTAIKGLITTFDQLSYPERTQLYEQYGYPLSTCPLVNPKTKVQIRSWKQLESAQLEETQINRRLWIDRLRLPWQAEASVDDFSIRQLIVLGEIRYWYGLLQTVHQTNTMVHRLGHVDTTHAYGVLRKKLCRAMLELSIPEYKSVITLDQDQHYTVESAQAHKFKGRNPETPSCLSYALYFSCELPDHLGLAKEQKFVHDRKEKTKQYNNKFDPSIERMDPHQQDDDTDFFNRRRRSNKKPAESTSTTTTASDVPDFIKDDDEKKKKEDDDVFFGDMHHIQEAIGRCRITYASAYQLGDYNTASVTAGSISYLFKLLKDDTNEALWSKYARDNETTYRSWLDRYSAHKSRMGNVTLNSELYKSRKKREAQTSKNIMMQHSIRDQMDKNPLLERFRCELLLPRQDLPRLPMMMMPPATLSSSSSSSWQLDGSLIHTNRYGHFIVRRCTQDVTKYTLTLDTFADDVVRAGDILYWGEVDVYATVNSSKCQHCGRLVIPSNYRHCLRCQDTQYCSHECLTSAHARYHGSICREGEINFNTQLTLQVMKREEESSAVEMCLLGHLIGQSIQSLDASTPPATADSNPTTPSPPTTTTPSTTPPPTAPQTIVHDMHKRVPLLSMMHMSLPSQVYMSVGDRMKRYSVFVALFPALAKNPFYDLVWFDQMLCAIRTHTIRCEDEYSGFLCKLLLHLQVTTDPSKVNCKLVYEKPKHPGEHMSVQLIALRPLRRGEPLLMAPHASLTTITPLMHVLHAQRFSSV